MDSHGKSLHSFCYLDLKIIILKRIHACTNIGSSRDDVSAPQIGNNVYIGSGAKIFGDIVIADNIASGANSVVNKSFYEKNISIAGIPAKNKYKRIRWNYIEATQILKRGLDSTKQLFSKRLLNNCSDAFAGYPAKR